MRKLIIFILLVIVLVSINWFRRAMAQDLGSLSTEDIARLRRQYEQKSAPAPQPEPGYYESPRIFEEDTASPGPPAAPVAAPSPPAPVRTGFERDRTLEPFEDLRPFGMELFENAGETNPPADLVSSDDYVLGPGDNVIVHLWGRVEHEYNLTLDREGKVFIPKVGDLIAWGLTLEQMRQRMKERLAAIYSDFELTASLGKIRSIRIYVTGEVRRPGAYTVSSLTSVLNAVFTAGGPNERGTMRAIAVTRGGAAAAAIDLYDLLLKGHNASDIRLQTGDVVFVPVTGPRVAVRGEIRRPAIYELSGGENVSDLLRLAGGPTAAAYLDRVMLERISPAGEWLVRDLNLNCGPAQPCDTIALADGDRVTVYSIYDLRTNMVAVGGRVKHPGCYERTDSTRVSDLIARGQLQPLDVYFERADVFRRYPDRRVEVIPIDLTRALAGDPASDIVLADRDSLHVYGIDDVRREQFVYIEGEVHKPGKYPLYDGMTVGDLIFLAGSFLRGADAGEAELARLDSLGNVAILPVSLSDSGGYRRLLCEDDHLFIRRIPEWDANRSVVVSGEVMYPGTYFLEGRHEGLHHLLGRAGGFTANAFPTGIIFQRRSIRDNLQRANVPALLEQSQPIVLDSNGVPTTDSFFSYRDESMDRIIIDMERILATGGSEGDVVMEPGDRVFIPPTPSGISVLGAVGANGTLKYVEGRRVKDYIERAGNFTRRADKKETRLIRAGGEVFAGGDVMGKAVRLGDIIVVPSQIKHDRDWLKT
ncbi:MAG TPA: SLBB domain-containing protein, partial [candidate division Zixibacteria bacterium]|nr:SLBB domain-containing protein [candidate division Zixibacteria bacterium]